jgi:hypothetical protein
VGGAAYLPGVSRKRKVKRVEGVRADINTLAVDAIVNAANRVLF